MCRGTAASTGTREARQSPCSWAVGPAINPTSQARTQLPLTLEPASQRARTHWPTALPAALADTPGYAAENETKPALCNAVNKAMGNELFPPDKVGRAAPLWRAGRQALRQAHCCESRG